MKNLLLAVTIALFGFSAHAQNKDKNAKVAFHVDGNCEMCKKRIEKAAIATPGVKSATWDISTETLSLIINEEKTNVETVQKAIAKVGHDNEGVKATAEDYSKLHTCCAYERTE